MSTGESIMKDNNGVIRIRQGKITTDFNIFYKYEHGRLACYIPAYQIAFQAIDEDQMLRRAKRMIQVFFQHWIEDHSWQKFAITIHKLGFRAPKSHDAAIQDIIKKRPSNLKFDSTDINSPIDVIDRGYMVEKSQMEVMA